MTGPDLADRESWIPVALGVDIGRETAAPALVAGMEVALWRGQSGEMHAWRDRCPHRGMRLSFGFVRGDDISCLYHGWRYGADGACRFIPAHPELEPPKTIGADVFACAERGGLVWMRAGGGQDGEPPDLGDAVPVRSLVFDAAADAVTAHLPADAVWVAANVASVATRLGAARAALLCAIQPVNERRAMLHLLVRAPGKRASGLANLQMRASHWGERFRRACEAAPGAEIATSGHAS